MKENRSEGYFCTKAGKCNKIIPKLISGSSTQVVMQEKRQALKMSKRVRQYPYFTTDRGFTLIELLVVILIIGVLAAVALPQYQLVVEKSHIAQAIPQVRALAQAEQAYYLANGTYTNNFDNLDINFETSTTVVAYLRQQKDWYLALSSIANQLVYAARGNAWDDSLFKNGRWYVSFLLDTNQMYCCAYPVDTKSTRLCKTFSDTPAEELKNIIDTECYLID